MIILWQNILGHQQVALNSLLTTLPNRSFYCADRAALYYTAVQLENLMRTVELENLMRTDRQTENSITEATLISLDHRGEGANLDYFHYIEYQHVWKCQSMTSCARIIRQERFNINFHYNRALKNKQANSKYRSLSNKIKYLLYFLCWARTATTVEIYVEIKNPNPKCTYFTRPGES